MASLTERMIGAALLDVKTYEEVEADPTAIGQAMTVVVISSVAAGIGAAGTGIGGIFAVTFGALVGWFIWAGLTFIIGTKLLPEPQTKSDIGELLRTIGFSTSPGILRIVGFIPFLGNLVSIAAGIWMLVTMVVAVRQALDYRSTGRAVGVCVIGWLIYMAVAFGIVVMMGAARAVMGG